MSEQTTESQEQRAREGRLVSAFTEGGHEVDTLSKGQLFGLVFGLTVVVLFTALGIGQFFNLQATQHEQAASERPSARLLEVRERDAAILSGWGVADEERSLYRMPVERAKTRVREDPRRLQAASPPEGFVHPDDAAKEAARSGDDDDETTEKAPAEEAPTEEAPEGEGTE